MAFTLLFPAALHAQIFSLGAASVKMPAFYAKPETQREVPVNSTDPAFSRASLTVANNSNGWLSSTLSEDGRSLVLRCNYGNGSNATAIVTVKSASTTATLALSRVAVSTYRVPRVLFSADLSKIFAIYQHTVLAYDAVSRDVVASAHLPGGSSASASPERNLSFSEDGSELRVFIADTPSLFRLTTKDLALLGSINLTPTSYTGGRVFAGEKADRFYFVRYGNISYGSDRHYDSIVEVVSATGAVLQSYRLPPPAPLAPTSENSVDDLAVHPTRPELWARHRYTLDGMHTTSLRRLSLGGDGLIGGVIGEPLTLHTTLSTYYRDPWDEDAPRFQFANDGQVSIGSRLLKDSESAPLILRTMPIDVGFHQAGTVASTDQVVRLDTNERFELSTLAKTTGTPRLVGLALDGLHFASVTEDFYGDPIPTVYFLPARIAALPGGRLRLPQAGTITPPTAELDWYSLPGADGYRVFISSQASDLAGAAPASSFLVGEPVASNLALPVSLAAGAVYFWRVDAIFGERILVGDVQSFAVSRAQVPTSLHEVATVAGARRRDFSLDVTTTADNPAWQILSDTPWLSVRAGAGIGPGSAEFSIDASTLAVGDHAVPLRLVTTDGIVPVLIRVRVQAVALGSFAPLRGATRLVAVGPSASVNGQAERLLLLIDSATEQIAFCNSVPAATLDLPSTARLSVTAADKSFYLFATGSTIGEFDPATLALRRIIKTTPLFDDAYPFSANEVRPADQGRLWMLDAQRLVLFSPDRSAYDLALSYPRATHAYLGDEGTTVYTFLRSYDIYNRVDAFTFRRFDLQGDTLSAVGERTTRLAAPIYAYQEQPLQGGAPVRFAFQGFALDAALNSAVPLGDAIVGASSGSPALLGLSLVYLGDDYTDARVQPVYDSGWRRLYEAASRKVVYSKADQLRFHSVDALPTVTPVSLKAVTINDTYASFTWDQPPVRGGRDYISANVQFRQAGGDSGWIPDDFSLGGLEPETTYEIRARAWAEGALSFWSPVLSFTTPVARPVYNSHAWPENQDYDADATVSLALPSPGKNLTWQVTGLPPGFAFDPNTRTIFGHADQPGSYRITITAANAGGTLTHSFSLRIAGTEWARPSARYTGALDIDGGPLMGIWQLTRSGDQISGTYRSPLFSRSFKAKFGAPSIVYHPIYSLRRSASTRVKYQGVSIGLRIEWDLDSDRVYLQASTWQLVNNFTASTTPETGLASHWSAPTQPHPVPGRYTGLLLPGEGTGPEGAGFFTLNLDAAGTAKISGETALGQKFTQSLPLSDVHSLPFFYFKGITIALGEITLTRELAPASPRLVGELAWARDSSRKSSAYRDGFEQQLLVFGAPLPAVGKTLPPLAPLANSENRADFRLSGGGLGRLSKPITQTLGLTDTGFTAPKAGMPENPNRVSVKLDAKTGVVTGSAAILNESGTKIVRTQRFRGMFVKDPLGDGQDVVGGYFLLPDAKGAIQSGRIEITEPEPLDQESSDLVAP